MQTLVLNSAYIPVNIVSWKKALKKVLKDKAEIVEIYTDEQIGHEWKSAMNAPAVIRLLHFMYPPKSKIRRFQPLTRRNVMLRDKAICQYCGKPLNMRTVTWDHIVPRDSGGKTTWTNIVCSCKKCNNKKANKSLAESGLKLIHEPYAPILVAEKTENHGFMEKVKRFPHSSWKQYIYWNTQLEE